ncbi:hypothetical protein EMIT0P253_10231 [Pseudomonas sp. IT-P253]
MPYVFCLSNLSKTARRGQIIYQRREPEDCAQIEAAAVDMNTAFDLEISQHCLKAR